MASTTYESADEKDFGPNRKKRDVSDKPNSKKYVQSMTTQVVSMIRSCCDYGRHVSNVCVIPMRHCLSGTMPNHIKMRTCFAVVLAATRRGGLAGHQVCLMSDLRCT